MTRGDDTANALLARTGMEVRVLCVSTDSGLSFRACGADDPAAIDWQRRSYRALGAELGCIQPLEGTPRLVVPGAVPEPAKLPDDQLVLPAKGVGYLNADNPNPACLGTVMEGPHLAGVAMPFDNEPAAYFMYVDTSRRGSPPYVVTAVLLGVWHRLTHGLVNRLAKLVRKTVTDSGRKFSFAKLWAWVSPGGRGDGIAISEDALAELREVGPPYEHYLYEGVGTSDREPHGLNLTGLFHQLIVAEGVPRRQIGVLPGVSAFSDPITARKPPWGRLRREGSDFIIIAGAVLTAT